MCPQFALRGYQHRGLDSGCCLAYTCGHQVGWPAPWCDFPHTNGTLHHAAPPVLRLSWLSQPLLAAPTSRPGLCFPKARVHTRISETRPCVNDRTGRPGLIGKALHQSATLHRDLGAGALSLSIVRLLSQRSLCVQMVCLGDACGTWTLFSFSLDEAPLSLHRISARGPLRPV